MTLALWNEGIHVNHKLVQRLMNKMGLLGVTPKAKYKSYKGGYEWHSKEFTVR